MGYKRGRKLNFNAIKAMEGMPVLVHDLELDTYDQLCYVYFDYVPVTSKTRGTTPLPKAKTKKQKQIGKEPIAIRNIHLKNEEFLFTYDNLGRCTNGEFECYAPVEDIRGNNNDGQYLFKDSE